MIVAGEPLPETLTELDTVVRGCVAAMRPVQVRLGRALAAIERIAREKGYVELRTTTFPQYCEAVGLSAGEGFQLRGAAEGCDRSPDLAAAVADNRVSPQKAAAVAQVIKKPELSKPGENWVALAEKKTMRELSDLVRERKEEARTGEHPTPRTIFLTSKGLSDLQRTRELVSRSLDRAASESEAVQTALAEYVDGHDPERRLDRAARRPSKGCAAPPTPAAPARAASAPRSRHIPAEEQRKVLAPRGDRCWVDGCDERSFLAFAHDKPFRLNGENVASNLSRYCDLHHRQADAGLWKVVQGRDGAVLVDRRGIVVGRLRPAPRDEAEAERSGPRPRGPPG